MTANILGKRLAGASIAFSGLILVVLGISGEQHAPGLSREALASQYASDVQPLLKKYCLSCHSTKIKKGSLDLERFASVDVVRKDLKPWQMLIEQLEAGEMPPKGKPQPTDVEKKQLLTWVRGFLDAEARARAGDPGHVPLRRLSNTEYDNTIRDLTGVDLRPTREFPADGAAGEGFTNAAEALTDISPALLTKYLGAAKDIADHAVLLPDGFRFSPGKTRRDWTDESTARLQKMYATYVAGDGKLAIQPYLDATVRHREALLAGKVTVAEIASREKLNGQYLGVLWQALSDSTPSFPLDQFRARWRQATEKDVAALANDIAAWQAALWKVVRVGSYMQPAGNGYKKSLSRQVANDPAAAAMQTVALTLKPAPGQSDVVLHLVARDLLHPETDFRVLWQRPRMEGAGKSTLLLRDYSQFGPAYEIDYPAVFATSGKYLAAVAEAANDPKMKAEELAERHSLDAAFLQRWIALLGIERQTPETEPAKIGHPVPAVALQRLDEHVPKNDQKPAINGWRKKGADLPALWTNSSDTEERIPGRAAAHGVVVHPTPDEFVAVTWQSPLTGEMRIEGRIAHVHPDCGNGVAWWLEHRRGEQAHVLAEGAIELGGAAKPASKTIKVEKGDLILLAVDAKDRNHVCDLTAIDLTLTEQAGTGKWDLAHDIADTIHAGNPHADRQGNPAVWSFVRGPTRPVVQAGGGIPANSVLGRWRDAAADPKRHAELAGLATQVQTLLAGQRPAKEKDPDRILYDNLVSAEGPLFQGIDATRLTKPRAGGAANGIPAEKFNEAGNLIGASGTVIEIRLPAALFRDRAFVVDGQIDGDIGDRVVTFQALAAAPGANLRWDGNSPVVASPSAANYRQLLQGCEEFRRVFPLFLCFPQVIPTDEVVSLKMFHREDEPLKRLFLDDAQAKHLDHLWTEHRFISRQPAAENAYLPQFIGFVTQDQPKEMVTYFEGLRPWFQEQAKQFENDEAAAVPKQLDALLAFASRAYRRPLLDQEQKELSGLYQTLRQKGVNHGEAFRGVLTRILVSPAFLFRIEKVPSGPNPAPVSDWELATRLSYFLWSSAPDDELRQLAAAGNLRDTTKLTAQMERMAKDAKVRSFAVEFGAQWLHVRGFDELKEKNDSLFPTFDANLKKAIYEETILFFQDLFQADRPVTSIIDADATYLNETLAKHYGISGIAGPNWRRVEGVRKYGRGGILGLASVQTTQAGASRTSPVLRGNWVVETLLGEKLPRPPANVPKLPEAEGTDQLTVRQMVEKHAKVAECAVCHQRIDPFGFALERYDPIGRLRDKDLGGLPVDAHARLKDGTEFDGIDGLRTYLLTKKQDVIVRVFCRRLLGYALGRSVTLSDTVLIDEMIAALDKNNGRVLAAVRVIVQSPQFRMIRGSEFAE